MNNEHDTQQSREPVALYETLPVDYFTCDDGEYLDLLPMNCDSESLERFSILQGI